MTEFGLASVGGSTSETAGVPARDSGHRARAGTSGLTVGYELGKLGYDYQVLEARDWVGGSAGLLPEARPTQRLTVRDRLVSSTMDSI